jgi:hypothetical protein
VGAVRLAAERGVAHAHTTARGNTAKKTMRGGNVSINPGLELAGWLVRAEGAKREWWEVPS